MKNYIIKPLLSKPGIQRDGTPFARESYTDGQWVRFYMGRPRKIGGYKLIDAGTPLIIRSIFPVAKNNNFIDLYMGRSGDINSKFAVCYNRFDFNGESQTGEIDRTPDGYFLNPNNVWNFDLFIGDNNDGSHTSYIVGSVIPNGNDIGNTVEGNIYYGDINSNDPLKQVFYAESTSENPLPVQVSGGIIFSSPVLIIFGNDGVIRWSQPGSLINGVTPNWSPEDFLVIANTKIVQACRTRGSTAPQILCWSLDSLINVTYSPTIIVDVEKPGFVSSTIQDKITIISPNSVVEFNQQFFWIGIDQFYVFNGIVQRLDNSMSTDWFFQNVNYKQRSKIWGMTIPRYKEIWWFYPRKKDPEDNPEECNAVIIYNTELKVWYDSVISRAAGVSPGVFPLPLMTDCEVENLPFRGEISDDYGIWVHEFGVNQVIAGAELAIPSYFETSFTTLFQDNAANNRLTRIRRIEPDFAQVGNMNLIVKTKKFPASEDITYGPFEFGARTEKIDLSIQARIASFRFESNEATGNYQAGTILLDYEIGDVRP